MRILVVDDSAYARQRIAKVLANAGHEVLEAPDGDEALQIMANRSPEAVTVDLLMPGMDGIELIQRLRDLRPEMLIVAVSADVQRTSRAAALAAGASTFVAKTDGPEALLDLLRDPDGSGAARGRVAPVLDALTEIMNIAMGQAAEALGGLLERRVQLKVPEVEVMRAAGLEVFFEREFPQAGAMVQQGFSGLMRGLGVLAFPQDHAVLLVRTLLGERRDLDRLSTAERSVLAEVGNVVLNAGIAVIGNLVGVRLKVDLPSVTLARSGPAMCGSILRGLPEADGALVLLSRMRIDDVDLLSYLILVMPGEHVDRLLTRLGCE